MINKWRSGYLIMLGLAILLVGLAGCKSEPDSSAPPVASNDGIAFKETPLKEEDIVKTLKANGVELTASPSDSYFKLNKMKPSIYALPGNERIMLYVYDTAKDTKKARLDFAEQTKVMNVNSPLFYNVKNILILYQPNVSGERPRERTNYNSGIESSIEQLLGDEIYVQHFKYYNVSKWKSFINSFINHQADQVKITSLTIEGDPIYIYLITDGTKLQYVHDNSEDAFGGSDTGASKTECTNIEQEKTEEGNIRYVATGCQIGDNRSIMTIPEDSMKKDSGS
ncbi:hypothetical protein PghCCS26_27870 [Paenibacillus glycanilyticus]|uniref:DUF4362 domain-containing protein n=1 Tax=Paenibacillus glycanilyticus TaxID=126569 RepID=A0ABQ6NNV9_9BACL|nr:DUF4362 domain-containing protein [Paenibacillus glycanilyticus]GMK45659.1 hypothetical protein PghCCS26_27870 [Paenibacillus glycanilyticus]